MVVEGEGAAEDGEGVGEARDDVGDVADDPEVRREAVVERERGVLGGGRDKEEQPERVRDALRRHALRVHDDAALAHAHQRAEHHRPQRHAPAHHRARHARRVHHRRRRPVRLHPRLRRTRWNPYRIIVLHCFFLFLFLSCQEQQQKS